MDYQTEVASTNQTTSKEPLTNLINELTEPIKFNINESDEEYETIVNDIASSVEKVSCIIS